MFELDKILEKFPGLNELTTGKLKEKGSRQAAQHIVSQTRHTGRTYLGYARETPTETPKDELKSLGRCAHTRWRDS